MGRLRAANGHPAPYNIKWWGIGNEMYGSVAVRGDAPNQYVFKHNMFAEAMRKVDPTITLLATGATPDEMTIYGIALPVVGSDTGLRVRRRLGLGIVHSLLRRDRHHVGAFLFLCRAEVRS